MNQVSENEAELSKSHLRAWLKIFKTSNSIEKLVRERLKKEFSTTLPRFDVMSALYHFDGGLKMSELSSELNVSNGNVTGLIDRLVNGGYVARVTVKGDRRANLIVLTTLGREQFEEFAKAHEKWIHGYLAGLGEDETKNLINNLEKI